MANKQNSNVSGTRFAEESAIGVLPGSPVWHPLEPNSFGDFGANYVTTARSPLSNKRSRQKGSITDMDASGSFTADVTQNSLTRLMQSMCFAAARETPKTQPLNGTGIAITSTTATTFAAAAGLNVFPVNALVKASGFAMDANNGLKLITASAAASLTTTGNAVEAAPPATAKLEMVGYQFPNGDIAMSVVGGQARMTSTAGGINALNLIPGQWVFLGGDGAAEKFATNIGFARISAITDTTLTFDKTDWAPAIEAGAGKTIRMFFGTVVRNEIDPTLIKLRSVQIERTLGDDGSGVQSEYLIGAVANTMTLSMPLADKVTSEMGFVAIDHETRTGAVGVKAGARPNLTGEEAFNTTSDFARVKVASIDNANSNPSSLFGIVTEMNLAINNKVTADKGLGKLGAFDVSYGDFEADGSITAYFTDHKAVAAIRANTDVTLDVVLYKKNAGLVFDIPVMNLGGGRLNVEKDKAIMIPVDGMGSESSFGHTMLFQAFAYLPSVAA